MIICIILSLQNIGKMNVKLKGAIYGVVAAVSYGTNPLGALFLYQEGLNSNSVLFYRFSFAAIILAVLMVMQKKPFSVTKKELLILGVLGILFAISALSLFTSFHYMDAGVASTILFVYPVMVAVIMAVFFKERISVITILSISLALGGIGLLYKSGSGSTLSTVGISLVIVSSLSYALYIIVVNKSNLIMSSVKLTFYVLLFCILVITIHSFKGESNHLQLLSTPTMWLWAIVLALVPTIISLIFMVKAVHAIGSTPTAIMGALEPLTAVVIGITIFGEVFTMRLAIGILMILSAVVFIIVGKSFSPQKLRITINHVGHTLKKHIRLK